MKYAVGLGLGAKFHKDLLRHSKVDRGYTDTQTANDRISRIQRMHLIEASLNKGRNIATGNFLVT
jgi:hypothetical protein